ncbi:CRISPR-associated RAMP protein Csx7 [Kyrpidia spormannii]|uniref:CRISPR-associated RAMP protein n=1 Tax=Kyrpidia spormannii TaxID=2055160 RepID=A0ACA8ZCW0_9BACL|nr:CRISPR-associated RAMP protein Csx7 [Kyrpidia spormannii]CAB3394564.1 CRISPR-associated RAMP protein [Kyrpidia spormannii]
MFRTLQIEAIIRYTVTPETPLSIRRGGSNPVDPGSPDDQLVKFWRSGQWVPVIPGSSVKGVFRSRAEQILKGNGLEVDDVFDKDNDSHRAQAAPKGGAGPRGHGRELYLHQCSASRLFGSLSLGSRIFFEDAIPEDPSTVVVDLRNGVGINRLTGGSASGVLYNYEVVEAGEFTGRITLQNFELWQLKLIVTLIQDLHDGRLRLGAATSRGLGRLRMVPERLQIVFLDYRQGPEPGQRPLRDAFDAVSLQPLEWRADLLRARAALDGMEAVVDFCRSLPSPSSELIPRKKKQAAERR